MCVFYHMVWYGMVWYGMVWYGMVVEYQTAPSMTWHPAKYEQSVVERLLHDQFHTFVHTVQTTDCQAELRRLLTAGPPVYICDKHAMPVPGANGNTNDDDMKDTKDTHICKLWFASSPKEERSAKLDGAKEGDERQALWEELKSFIIVEGKEAGDEDDNRKESS
jgi:hypothetical protein